MTSYFGRIIKEPVELPANMLHPIGVCFASRAKVEDDHAPITVTRMSKDDFIFHLNISPICWHSKKKNSVELTRLRVFCYEVTLRVLSRHKGLIANDGHLFQGPYLFS